MTQLGRSLVGPFVPQAQPAMWNAQINRRVHNVLPDDGTLLVGSLTSFGDHMRLDFVMRSPSIGSRPREHMFELRVTDDVGTSYQTLGGGFDTEFDVCPGEREIRPCPPASATTLRLSISPRRQPSDSDPEGTTLVIALPSVQA